MKPSHGLSSRTDTFGGSVWASVPRLVALEKNYTEEELDEKTVDLGAWGDSLLLPIPRR
jgi:hypothetical protein